jgi:hypothetical protein
VNTDKVLPLFGEEVDRISGIDVWDICGKISEAEHWRNGSASDSRPEGCGFDSRMLHNDFATQLLTNQRILTPTLHQTVGSRRIVSSL